MLENEQTQERERGERDGVIQVGEVNGDTGERERERDG